MARSIDAGTCGGIEGVRIVLIEVFKQDTKLDEMYLERLAEEYSKKAGGFLAYNDNIIGRALMEEDGTVDRFYSWLMSNETVNKIADFEYVKMWGNRAWVTDYMAYDLGFRLKKTNWWGVNLKKLDRFKKELKIVKKVMID